MNKIILHITRAGVAAALAGGALLATIGSASATTPQPNERIAVIDSGRQVFSDHGSPQIGYRSAGDHSGGPAYADPWVTDQLTRLDPWVTGQVAALDPWVTGQLTDLDPWITGQLAAFPPSSSQSHRLDTA
ncbi:hypothetical protein ACF06D_29140 [Streptomyces griseoluteus]|uniref:hypothetical protein n=1 Tax=Streptomyces TaxID=1883 RepID=UPI000A3CBD13|nr:hypothetical protein [Streptomyces recifensis]